MSKIRLLVFTSIICCIGLCSQVFANQVDEAKKENSSLTKSEIRHAESWGLSKDEYKEFQRILTTPRAFFTPNLKNNPLLALALESESQEERDRYADRWVKIQFDNNVKVVSWQLTVNGAWDRNYPGYKPFAYKKHGLEHQTIKSLVNPDKRPIDDLFKPDNRPLPFAIEKKRVQLYITASNCNKCDNAFLQQYKELEKGIVGGIDVFFVGGESQEDIVRWAVMQKLSKEDVNEHRLVTLNHSKKQLKKIPYVEFK